MISNEKMTSDMWIESQASYRLVYELILPFLMPIILLGKKLQPTAIFTPVWSKMSSFRGK